MRPLACASVVATIDAMKDERILENAAAIGPACSALVCASRRSGTR